MSSRIIPVVLARLDSQRLPGKVLKPFLGGKSIIEVLLDQLECMTERISAISAPVIATTARPVDAPIVRAASHQDTAVLMGNLSPLIRMQQISIANPEDWLWRLNADSPLILQPLIERAAEVIPALDDGIQIITNLVERSFPYGVSLELFRADMITKIDMDRAKPEELEHLTPIVQRLPPEGVCSIIAQELGISPFDSRVRLTIDSAEDAAFFGKLWDDPVFQRTRPGSVERIEFAYHRRLSSAT